MNRRERRAASSTSTKSNLGTSLRKGWFEGKGKAKVTLHTEPNETNQAQLAVLLTALGYAFTVSQKLEGNVPGVAWPVHIAVDFGGINMCGTVEPSDGESGEPIVDLTMH